MNFMLIIFYSLQGVHTPLPSFGAVLNFTSRGQQSAARLVRAPAGKIPRSTWFMRRLTMWKFVKIGDGRGIDGCCISPQRGNHCHHAGLQSKIVQLPC